MRKKALLLLALLSSTALFSSAFAACPPAEQLQQAFFSLTPQASGAITQLPVADPDKNSNNMLYFFSRVSGNTSGALVHRWRHNNQLVASIHLKNGNASWQSWSAQSLDNSKGGKWEVDVLDDHLCLLGKVEINTADDDTLLDQARKLLANQDMVGAKLLLKQALAEAHVSSADKRRWQAFMEGELVLAEAAGDIKQAQFVAAEGRLQSLAGKLDGALAVKYQALQQQLRSARASADQTRLRQWMAAIHSLSISAACPADRNAALALLTPLLPTANTGMSAFDKQENQISLTVTLPSGTSKQLGWSCLTLVSLP